jgi:hypothetical protein
MIPIAGHLAFSGKRVGQTGLDHLHFYAQALGISSYSLALIRRKASQRLIEVSKILRLRRKRVVRLISFSVSLSWIKPC